MAGTHGGLRRLWVLALLAVLAALPGQSRADTDKQAADAIRQDAQVVTDALKAQDAELRNVDEGKLSEEQKKDLAEFHADVSRMLREWQFLWRGTEMPQPSEVEHQCQDIDAFATNAVRNSLFGASGRKPAADLIAINIQRGREVGTPSYQQVREALGLCNSD